MRSQAEYEISATCVCYMEICHQFFSTQEYKRRLNDFLSLNYKGLLESHICKITKGYGQAKMNWQEKYLLIVDEVSMLGARTLHAVNEQLCRLRESRQNFGGIPIVLFCGDFHQFRPVQERSILLPSLALPWNEENSFTMEQRRQHDKAHAF